MILIDPLRYAHLPLFPVPSLFFSRRRDSAIGYAEHYSRSHDAVIRVYDATGKVIETHEYKGDLKEW